MINIDDRLYQRVDGNEFWLLNQIVRRMNKNMFCFPSNDTLLKDTGWAIDKLQRVKKSLVAKGLISVESRYNEEERQSTNIYHVETDLIGVFVDGKRLSYPPENTVGHPVKTNTTEGAEKPVTEVLTREEVLTSESKDSLFNQDERMSTGRTSKRAVIKPKKAAHPAFALCVDHWLKVVHPGWSFSATDGKAMNSIIRKIEKRLEERKHSYTGWVDDEMPPVILNSFRHILKQMPEWYKNQTLTVLDSKFDSIIEQIRNGGTGKDNWHNKTSAARIIESL